MSAHTMRALEAGGILIDALRIGAASLNYRNLAILVQKYLQPLYV